MKRLDISDSRRLGGVGQKQRERLLRVVDDADYRRELLNDQRKRDGGTP